jgi:hypothetical protein
MTAPKIHRRHRLRAAQLLVGDWQLKPDAREFVDFGHGGTDAMRELAAQIAWSEPPPKPGLVRRLLGWLGGGR